jgi:hypothetical protein
MSESAAHENHNDDTPVTSDTTKGSTVCRERQRQLFDRSPCNEVDRLEMIQQCKIGILKCIYTILMDIHDSDTDKPANKGEEDNKKKN